jgi:general secretion pathway protein G
MHPPKARPSTAVARGRRAFTLLEMMLVVVIMGILASVAVFAIRGRIAETRIGTTQASLNTIKSALEMYNGKYAVYPAVLDDLTVGATRMITPPMPKDGWKRDFRYYYPSASGLDPDTRPFDLFSMGPDGIPNTPDDIDAFAAPQ